MATLKAELSLSESHSPLNWGAELEALGLDALPWSGLLTEKNVRTAAELEDDWSWRQRLAPSPRTRAKMLSGWSELAKFWQVSERPSEVDARLGELVRNPMGREAMDLFLRDDPLAMCLGVVGQAGWAQRWLDCRAIAIDMLGDQGLGSFAAMHCAKQAWSKAILETEPLDDLPRSSMACSAMGKGLPLRASQDWRMAPGWPAELSLSLMFEGPGSAWRAASRISPGEWYCPGPHASSLGESDPSKSRCALLIKEACSHLRMISPTYEEWARCSPKAKAVAKACIEASKALSLVESLPKGAVPRPGSPPVELQELLSRLEAAELEAEVDLGARRGAGPRV